MYTGRLPVTVVVGIIITHTMGRPTIRGRGVPDHNIIFQRSKGYLTFDTPKLSINYSLILTHNGGNDESLIVYRAVRVYTLLLLLLLSLCLEVPAIIIIDHVIIISHHSYYSRSSATLLGHLISVEPLSLASIF